MSTQHFLARKPLPLLKRLPLVLWVLLWPITIAMFLSPIRFGGLRLAIVVSVVALWAGAVALCWKYKAARVAGAALGVCVLALLITPSRSVEPDTLRHKYVQSLNRYENVPYIWGGENKRGIDCSGLVRCALIDANLQQGLSNANPAALREAIALWWNDASAKHLGQGYAGKTRFLFEASSLNELDYNRLKPGDFAVTSPDGVHSLAYIGNRTWIEADPSALVGDKVIKVTVPTRNAWFNRKVRIMRWRQFEAPAQIQKKSP